jgi:hypothetical protein
MNMDDSIASIAISLDKLLNYNAMIASKICNLNSLIYSNGIIIDLKFYKETYPDLQHMTNDELICHYQKFGKDERRLSCENLFDYVYPDFDSECYLKFYPDLQQKNFTKSQGKAHFWQWGALENRVYFKNTIHHPLHEKITP